MTTFDNWPMDQLVTGHSWDSEIACNWKVFWENYSECLHCPGIHPELCDLVPIYGQGIMGANETRAGQPPREPGPSLRLGAESWTMDGALCGPAFPKLTSAERQAGYTFVTLWPSAFVVAHPDYVYGEADQLQRVAVDVAPQLDEFAHPLGERITQIRHVTEAAS